MLAQPELQYTETTITVTVKAIDVELFLLAKRLIVGVLLSGNIEGHTRTGTDLLQHTLMVTL